MNESKRDNQNISTRWLQWVEWGARLFVWAFGLVFASLAVLGIIRTEPENTAMLTTYLIIFLIAALVTGWLDLARMYPTRKK
jgi:heme A synthase